MFVGTTYSIRRRGRGLRYNVDVGRGVSTENPHQEEQLFGIVGRCDAIYATVQQRWCHFGGKTGKFQFNFLVYNFFRNVFLCVYSFLLPCGSSQQEVISRRWR